ncbi:hypothetical protein [Lysobacter gummosus]|uniref:hypothetical protein n=1 Tax=Lysobacter gummosus TaxID=262324 RepID=UPI00363FA24B
MSPRSESGRRRRCIRALPPESGGRTRLSPRRGLSACADRRPARAAPSPRRSSR